MQSFRQYKKLKIQIQTQFQKHAIATGSALEDDSARVQLGDARPLPNQELTQASIAQSPTSTAHSLNFETVEKVAEGQSPIYSGDSRSVNDEDDGTAARHVTELQDVEAQEGTLKEARAETDGEGDGAGIRRLLTGISVRRRTTREGGGEDKIFVVGFHGEDDELNPHNWPMRTRAFAMLRVGFIGWIVGFATSVDSAVIPEAANEFGVSKVAESGATSLFLLAFGFGSLIAGPFSEEFGRNPVYIFNLALFAIFTMASALSPNIAAQFVFRFMAGIFGSTPLTCAGGSLSDLFTPKERVIVFPVFATAAFVGPICGPAVGGAIAQSTALSWRWVEWTTLIITGAILVSMVLFQPETYAPILLKYKAELLREATNDRRYVAAVEIRAETFFHRLRRALYRPFDILIREPILILLTLYLTTCFVVFFGFLDGYEFIFGETYQLSQASVGLAFFGLAVGVLLADAMIPAINHFYCRALARAKVNSVNRLPPELRLWWAMIGAPVMPISLFWMGWTTRPDISLWSPLVASVGFGFSMLCIFISCYQYIIDSYEIFAASALASFAFVRYALSGAITVAGIPMYTNLGVNWSLTVFACLGVVLTPVPFLFYRYGERIRGYSSFAID